jgi:hypothetical protein
MTTDPPVEPASTKAAASDGRRARRRSLFSRGEHVIAHTVYGVILTLATLGELIHHEVAAGTSVAWLLGSGVVLLAAHMFSDVLAHVATTQEDPRWRELLSIGRADLSVATGAVVAALVMAVAAIADLDSEASLTWCVALGLVTVAALSFYALSNHRVALRFLMAGLAVVLGAVIVLLENTF